MKPFFKLGADYSEEEILGRIQENIEIRKVLNIPEARAGTNGDGEESVAHATSARGSNGHRRRQPVTLRDVNFAEIDNLWHRILEVNSPYAAPGSGARSVAKQGVNLWHKVFSRAQHYFNTHAKRLFEQILAGLHSLDYNARQSLRFSEQVAADLESTTAALRHQMSALESRLAEQEEQVESLSQENSQLKSALDRSENNHRQQENRLKAFDVAWATGRDDIDTLQLGLERMQQSVADQQIEADRHAGVIDELTGQFTALEATVTGIRRSGEKEREALQDRMADLTSDWEERWQQTDQQRKEQQLDLNKLKDRFATRAQQTEKRIYRLTESLEQHKTAAGEFESNAKERLENLEKDQTTYEQRLNAVVQRQEGNEKWATMLSERVDQAATGLHDLNQAFRDQQPRLDNHTRRLDAVDERLQQQENENRKAAESVQEVQSRLQQAGEETARSHQRIGTFERRLGELEPAHKEMADLRLPALEEKLSLLRNETSAARDELRDEFLRQEEWLKSLTEREEGYEKWTHDLNERVEENRRLREELANRCEKLEGALAGFAEMKDLPQVLESHASRLQAAEQEIARTQQQLQEDSPRLRQCDATLEQVSQALADQKKNLLDLEAATQALRDGQQTQEQAVGLCERRLEDLDGRLKSTADGNETIEKRTIGLEERLAQREREGHYLSERMGEMTERSHQQAERFATLEEKVAGQGAVLENGRQQADAVTARVDGTEKWMNSLAERVDGAEKWTGNLAGRVETFEKAYADLRHEMLSEIHFTVNRTGEALEPRIVDPESFLKKKKAHKGGLRVNLGCGNKVMEDYVNVDMRELDGVDVVADVANLPFDKGALAELHHEHVIEHFPEYEMKERVLPYWKSLLKPGGKISIVCPNWEAILRRYQEGDISYDWMKQLTFGGQDTAGNYHFNMYTTETLKALLEEAGFKKVEVVATDRDNFGCPEMEVVAETPRRRTTRKKAGGSSKAGKSGKGKASSSE